MLILCFYGASVAEETAKTKISPEAATKARNAAEMSGTMWGALTGLGFGLRTANPIVMGVAPIVFGTLGQIVGGKLHDTAMGRLDMLFEEAAIKHDLESGGMGPLRRWDEFQMQTTR